MDLKLFLLVGLCCVLRASANDMREKGMQALKSGQLNRLHSRFGRKFDMPPLRDDEPTEEELEKLMNEILNTIPADLDGLEGFEPGMADNKWHLPLEKQLLKYFWATKPRKA